MKNHDRIKEEIGFEKLLMTIAFAAFSSIVGWLFKNYSHLSLVTLTLFSIASILLIVIIFLFVNVNTKIKELDYGN